MREAGLDLTVASESYALARAFAISRGSKTEAQVVVVHARVDGVVGRGECVPYGRYGESIVSVVRQIRELPGFFDQAGLQHLLPAGAARNAVDCALWDLRAKQTGKRVWQLAGLPRPQPVLTAYTLSIESPDAMRVAAARNAARPLLKVKLGSEDDIARLEAVRSGAPKSRLIIDANEAWTPELYRAIAPVLQRLGVAMVEQPLPSGADDALAEMHRIVPVCADESCHDRASLPALKGKYDLVNVKLDKTGGLTEALALKVAARSHGFGIMTGCMVATSLSMAPATLVAQGGAYADLDGPLLLAADRENGLRYDQAGVHPPEIEFWG